MPSPAMVLVLQCMLVEPICSGVSFALHVMLLLPSVSGGMLCVMVIAVGTVRAVMIVDGELWSVLIMVRIIL